MSVAEGRKYDMGMSIRLQLLFFSSSPAFQPGILLQNEDQRILVCFHHPSHSFDSWNAENTSFPGYSNYNWAICKPIVSSSYHSSIALPYNYRHNRRIKSRCSRHCSHTIAERIISWIIGELCVIRTGGVLGIFVDNTWTI